MATQVGNLYNQLLLAWLWMLPITAQLLRHPHPAAMRSLPPSTPVQNYTGTATATMYIQSTHSITLVPGWNLVSFNLHPMDTLTGTVLNGIAGKYDLVYGWDATGGHVSSGNWLKFAPGGPSYANSLTNMDETMGFWIHMSPRSIRLPP